MNTDHNRPHSNTASKVVPLVREDSHPIGFLSLPPVGKRYIEANKDLLFVPRYNDDGKLVTLRAVRDELCSYENCGR